MSNVQDIQDVDLYELLGIEFNASVQEVKSAYRKKALTCHPDKNPDNPKATELFHQLSRALEILIDASARAAYDKVLNAKKAAVLRNRELDSRRKKLKEDLEARERQAEEARKKHHFYDKRTDEEKLQAEIERLRKEGSKQVEEEVEYVRQQVLQEKLSKDASSSCKETPKRLRIYWEADKNDLDNGGYNYELLHRMLSKYGEIAALIISPKKKGSALVEFATKEAAKRQAVNSSNGNLLSCKNPLLLPAKPPSLSNSSTESLVNKWMKNNEMAQELERGLTKNPLKLQMLGKEGASFTSSRVFPKTVFKNSGEEHAPGNTQAEKARTGPSTFPSFSFSPNIVNEPNLNTGTDFESLVLRRMRQAEERRRLTEEIMKSQHSSDD